MVAFMKCQHVIPKSQSNTLKITVSDPYLACKSLSCSAYRRLSSFTCSLSYHVVNKKTDYIHVPLVGRLCTPCCAFSTSHNLQYSNTMVRFDGLKQPTVCVMTNSRMVHKISAKSIREGGRGGTIHLPLLRIEAF